MLHFNKFLPTSAQGQLECELSPRNVHFFSLYLIFILFLFAWLIKIVITILKKFLFNKLLPSNPKKISMYYDEWISIIVFIDWSYSSKTIYRPVVSLNVMERERALNFTLWLALLLNQFQNRHLITLFYRYIDIINIHEYKQFARYLS